MGTQLQNHIESVKRDAGTRTFFLEKVGLPEGWYVTSNVPKGFWEKCKAFAIPLEAKRLLGIFPTPATKEMQNWVTTYGADIMVVLIPDDEALNMYSYGPIRKKDLDRAPNDLFNEAMEIVGKNTELSTLLIRCAMVLLGWSDTN